MILKLNMKNKRFIVKEGIESISRDKMRHLKVFLNRLYSNRFQEQFLL